MVHLDIISLPRHAGNCEGAAKNSQQAARNCKELQVMMMMTMTLMVMLMMMIMMMVMMMRRKT